MGCLVVGATGATGRLLVQQLLDRGRQVKAIVRSEQKLPDGLRDDERLTVTQASLLELSDTQMAEHVAGCGAVASCLGHNLSMKGLYGHPRRLVTDAVRRLCDAIKAAGASKPTRLVLMNTAGNRNGDLDEPVSLAQRGVLALLRLALPPHADNEEAADYLRLAIGQDDGRIQWAAVRPDTLVDQDEVTAYELHASPIRSALFNPGKTSRINVAHFMAELMTDAETWSRWKGQMPVIYDSASG